MELFSRHDEEQTIWQVSTGGNTLLEYIYGEREDPNPSFRLVRTIGGHDIALYRPWDHPWHPGMFFSWKYINGLNFWESMHAGQRNVAVTDAFRPFGNEGTGFQQSISYVTHEGDTLLKEERTISIAASEGGYLIRWQGAFTPEGGDVTLNRTEVNERSPWGGYAGLSCRLGRNYLGPVITTDQGVFTAEDAHGQPFNWCDYAGKLDGYLEKRWAGICLMDDPSNPRHPTRMLTYDYKDMQFLHAAFLHGEPYTLRAGETLRLRYAFFVHDGEALPEDIALIYGDAFKDYHYTSQGAGRNL